MDNPTVTFESDKPVTAVLDKNKLELGVLTAETIFDKLANQYANSEYPEMYFYCLVAIQDTCNSIISGIGAENMKKGLEL